MGWWVGWLELLSEDEVELTSAVTLRTVDVVKSVCPVKTHQTDHREEEAYTEPCRAFHVEGVELIYFVPCISCFGECQCIDVGGAVQQEWVAEGEGHGVVGITIVVTLCECSVVVSARAAGFGGVGGRVARHAVT